MGRLISTFVTGLADVTVLHDTCLLIFEYPIIWPFVLQAAFAP
jgi:hypothetical protein